MKTLLALMLLAAATAMAGDYNYQRNNAPVNLYQDRYGNTMGNVGNERVNLYSDRYGNTMGNVGRDRVNLYTDRYGNTMGTIGDQRINIHDTNPQNRRNW